METKFFRTLAVNVNMNPIRMANEQWRGMICRTCGRSYPETMLDIERWIHHKEGDPRCINVKECQRIARKKKRRNLYNNKKSTKQSL